jgi:hypothetical protein
MSLTKAPALSADREGRIDEGGRVHEASRDHISTIKLDDVLKYMHASMNYWVG